jgi:hypothetical protein
MTCNGPKHISAKQNTSNLRKYTEDRFQTLTNNYSCPALVMAAGHITGPGQGRNTSGPAYITCNGPKHIFAKQNTSNMRKYTDKD